jgi:hypothetical protein
MKRKAQINERERLLKGLSTLKNIATISLN